MGRRKWSNEEEQVLIDQVRHYPNNLSRAFKVTGEEIGKSEDAVRNQWYNHTRHSETIFMTVGAKNMNINSKNSSTTQPIQLSIWRRILRLLGL